MLASELDNLDVCLPVEIVDKKQSVLEKHRFPVEGVIQEMTRVIVNDHAGRCVSHRGQQVTIVVQLISNQEYLFASD